MNTLERSTVNVLLSSGPGPMLEFMLEPDAGKLAEQIVAFANSVGGTVVVGMNDQGHISPDVCEYLEPILARAVQMCMPRFPAEELLRCHHEQVSGGQITTITVEHSPYRLSVEGRGVFVRSGKLNIHLSPEQVAKDEVDRVVRNFEDEVIPGASLGDLDEALVEEYQRKRTARGPRGETLTHQELLRDAGAVSAQEAPTTVGLLLFGRNPQRFLPQARIVLVRYKGTNVHEAAIGSERYARRVDVEGPLARQVERAWEVLFEEINQESTVSGLERKEKFVYPPQAVREALVNAICHRDYGVSGQYVEIRLFDDRMEIMSPGGLPGHITLDNILDEHYSRNPRLVRGLFYWGYIEELGQGVDIIYGAMRREHHPDPEFRDTGRNFTVILHNRVDWVAAEYGADINPRQMKVLRFLEKNDRITNSQYRDLSPDVTSETLRLDLRDLVEKGLLLKIGDKKGTYYVRK
jgi:ATP-dependent DNA helicase RecG